RSPLAWRRTGVELRVRRALERRLHHAIAVLVAVDQSISGLLVHESSFNGEINTAGTARAFLRSARDRLPNCNKSCEPAGPLPPAGAARTIPRERRTAASPVRTRRAAAATETATCSARGSRREPPRRSPPP